MAIITRILTVVVHPAKEGGYWAEVIELPGCVSQGETLDELRKNIREAIEAVSQSETFGVEIQFESVVSEFRVSPTSQSNLPDLPIGGTETRTAAVASA